jgi:proteasome accessory factor C
MSASARFNRIVSMVAELTRREREGEGAATLGDIAQRHGMSVKDVLADVRTLTVLTDRIEADWLLSLRLWQQEDRVSLSSSGPFRRPVRLSPEEQLAVQMALAMDPNGAALAARLASLWDGDAPAPSRSASPEASAVEIVRRAVREHIALKIEYAGEADREVRTRVIHPHQVAESGVRTYIVAWAGDVGAWRHFRLDRIVAARMTETHFEPRTDFEPLTQPGDAFRPGGATERVTVRFRPEVAPWVTEYYTDHDREADGSVRVHFEATSADWLVRRVLEFGPDAEVVAPAEYRAAVARAVA